MVDPAFGKEFVRVDEEVAHQGTVARTRGADVAVFRAGPPGGSSETAPPFAPRLVSLPPMRPRLGETAVAVATVGLFGTWVVIF